MDLYLPESRLATPSNTEPLAPADDHWPIAVDSTPLACADLPRLVPLVPTAVADLPTAVEYCPPADADFPTAVASVFPVLAEAPMATESTVSAVALAPNAVAFAAAERALYQTAVVFVSDARAREPYTVVVSLKLLEFPEGSPNGTQAVPLKIYVPTAPGKSWVRVVAPLFMVRFTEAL